MPFVAFVNASSRLSNTEADVIVEALRLQARDEFSKLWPGIELWQPIFVASEDRLPQNAYPIVFVDEADQPNFDAYHGIDRGGKYFGHVFVNLLLEQGGVFEAVSRGAGHEYFELLGNPTCNLCVDGPPIAIVDEATGARTESTRYYFELCDPVQAVTYAKTVDRGRKYVVQVPDIAGPGYFGQAGPLSITGAPKGPFKVADGGYQVLRDTRGNDHNVFGMGGAASPSPEVIANIQRNHRRTRRRTIDKLKLWPANVEELAGLNIKSSLY